MIGKCRDCKAENIKISKHSEIGSHKPPYIYLCRPCHDKRHKIKQKRFKRTQRGTNGKRHKGTRR